MIIYSIIMNNNFVTGVYNRLNSYFGEDVSSLSRAGELADTLKLDLHQLEERYYVDC